ncbi:MAG: TetR/AcrR family transcriptional regulator [Porticoccaceae bacterium]|nr:TetR/AcrR family transcriptional regulator [Porticoccaceae bacterium]
MTESITAQAARSHYHHGDLRKTLLVAAKDLITQHGIESLSLRKLAEKIGVSRTAAYHHFKDKNDLLCAIAAQGFRRRQQEMLKQNKDSKQTERQKLQQYICAYVHFAVENPEEYELMFGRCIWKQAKCTAELREVAYASFQQQVEMVGQWQAVGLISGDNPLRTAQVLWGTLHGIAKLFIDGIYTDVARVEEIALTAVPLFVSGSD